MSELKNQNQQPKKTPTRVQAKEGAIKKKPFFKRVRETFFAESLESVGAYLWKDVLLPAIKKLILDSGTNALYMAVNGKPKPPNYGQGGNYISQSSVYAGHNVMQQSNYYNRSNRYHNVMERMPPCDESLLKEIIDEATLFMRNNNGKISVEDFNSCLPDPLVFPTVHTDRYWGWTYLDYSCIVPGAGGYVLNMPPAVALQ